MTPGQAAYEAWVYMEPCLVPRTWEDLEPVDRGAWEYVALKAIEAHAEANG